MPEFVGDRGGYHPLALVACHAIEDEMVAAGFELRPPGYWSFTLNGLELTFEPLTFGRFDVALYRGRDPVLEEKVTVLLP